MEERVAAEKRGKHDKGFSVQFITFQRGGGHWALADGKRWKRLCVWELRAASWDLGELRSISDGRWALGFGRQQKVEEAVSLGDESYELRAASWTTGDGSWVTGDGLWVMGVGRR